MRLNPGPPTPYSIKHADLFVDAWFNRIAPVLPFANEALDALEWSLARKPDNEGEFCPAFFDRHFRVTVTPKTRRYPPLRFLFEIEQSRVVIWHVCVALE